jgi:hypothetical protein
MAGPYRNNVVQAFANKAATFNPPLDAIYVTAAPTTSVDITVANASVTVAAAQLAVGTIWEVGDITAIAANSSFKYIGLRVMNKSGSSNATSDNLDVT